jgi:hypothetical protein
LGHDATHLPKTLLAQVDFAGSGMVFPYLPAVKIPPAPFTKGGDIPRLSSDRMPERIACRQLSENSRTFPPFEKWGSGGISIFYIPALSTTTRQTFSIPAPVSTITCRL